MIDHIIHFSLKNKLIVFLFTAVLIGGGIYSLLNLPIGAVPDITNNQVQVITTSRNLATEDVEKFITYPVELEMANLPGVKEIRSISKFGLSVVTVVFEDKMGSYLPRQLIAEKIKSAEEQIPSNFGKPFMGPVTTGLGEIYQYVIDVDSNYKDWYSLSDIRTIQDWVVKRQLSGIPGVVEINTWGGYLKQYEVAINPAQLRSLNIPIGKVFQALENNNGIAGGAYIEKQQQSYFVRAEGLLESLSDIENIVVERRNNIPILIKDLATVDFGHATRFGAITGNAEGEKVLGQVMMLKDADSKAVIDAVKARVAKVQKTLPKGISINPILERSELIGKTTFTIAENLILGCLIVIFVVVLLLGNWRSGLVVASVIPLTLLFAISMMYIFGVDANLMSLGAIDFGIIIDGAVIIIEYIAFKISSERENILSLSKEKRQAFKDQITFKGASKMMHSAVFGQLIIIIVFIPILSLVGVEGKMFRPMALVFSFALTGAMLLCFTYVPVMASLFIKPSNLEKSTVSSRLIDFLKRFYRPTIVWAMDKKALVLSLSAALLIGSALLFNSMGGEFVPTLDEGDFVIQPVLKTGTSLGETVKITSQIEEVLMAFPEVEQIASRIGAAEVPTDPMSMEESDVIIKLNPRSEWTSAESKDELANVFKEALLAKIPGVEYEFTQPIEMRFNELITGTRSDLAIKIFGEDLDILYQKALEVEKAIQNIPGAADISVEKTAGLPQMSVKYDRAKLAEFGINIADLNQIISTGFAGSNAGKVFEGERSFDLVLRFDEEHRNEISDIRNASIMAANGEHYPLSEFAEIKYALGPAKISRDDTKRRIVIGVNVRGRDLESVVIDVQKTIAAKVELPTGYTVDYGGQFENLRAASKRLMIAVPIALLLIFFLLYFAFNSVKEALIIYSAIPLSAVGGIWLLYLRDLPFSISAGVGFIALFGIAVLNGIVLIEEFKELKADGIIDMKERIIKGTQARLRPVLLTASAAALGFLPMAISTSAGAEVQRPLATVVVGGLISATALTLIVLPILYAIFDSKKIVLKKRKKKHYQTGLLALLITLLPLSGFAQNNGPSLEEAVAIALKNNLKLKASELSSMEKQKLIATAFNFEKTNVYYNFDENNIAPNNSALSVWGVQQNFSFPSTYGAQRGLKKEEWREAQLEFTWQETALEAAVSAAYVKVIYWQKQRDIAVFIDSLYQKTAQSAALSFKAGESDYLTKITAESKAHHTNLRKVQALADLEKASMDLQKLLQADSVLKVPQQDMPMLNINLSDSLANNPSIALGMQREKIQQKQISLSRNQLLPDLQVEYFQGNNALAPTDIYQGFQAGISIPLWFGAQSAQIRSQKIALQKIAAQNENLMIEMRSERAQLFKEIYKWKMGIDHYENEGKDISANIIKHAEIAYQKGEINFIEYSLLLENAQEIKTNYLDNLMAYNLSVLKLNYQLK